MKGLPKNMLGRIVSFGVFSLGLGFTSLGNVAHLATVPFMAWLGFGIAMLLFVMWGPRTRPVPNAFWILLGLAWMVLILVPSRPVLGLVAGLPVALIMLHDGPSTPTAMLSYGTFVSLWHVNLDVWNDAGRDEAFWVGTAMVFIVGGAMLERERLARGQYAPVTQGWQWLRAGFIALFTMTFIAMRESVQVASFFTYLGIDIRGSGGRAAMVAVLITALAIALFLFRIRPEKAPKAAPPRPGKVAPEKAAVAAKAEAEARVPASQPLNFDEGPGSAPAEGERRAGKMRLPSQAPVKGTKRPAAKASEERAKPGGLDFD